MIPIFRILLLMCFASLTFGQSFDPAVIQQKIEAYKDDPRGPYRDIRWFCEDGTILLPKESCPEPGGVQRARYKPDLIELGEKHHLYFGQILATTDIQDFWDVDNRHSRLKQYLLGQYLQQIDDGWVNRKGQYYRGAFQIEDEKDWGKDFLKQILAAEDNIDKHFFLLRQAAKVIPHKADSDRAQLIRALSKVIAEENDSFMPIRIKIHGQPTEADIRAVEAYLSKNTAQLKGKSQEQLKELISEMKLFYAPFEFSELDEYLKYIADSPLKESLSNSAAAWTNDLPLADKVSIISRMILDIRQQIKSVDSRTSRLSAIDLSIALEEELFKMAATWEPAQRNAFVEKIYVLGTALAGTGFLELWEWKAIQLSLREAPAEGDSDQWKLYLGNAQRIIEWSSNMSRAAFGDVVDTYQTFEPKAYGFLDDVIRGSILLNAGETVGQFAALLTKDDASKNYLLGYPQAASARGLNPGTAMGALAVIRSATEEMEVDKSKIYVFDRPPSDLKPVAGIATVSEGNMVSHVQLLARNLAIPNAVISADQLEYLSEYQGQEVYYVVDKSGNVHIKLATEMTDAEKARFTKKERNLNKVTVPVDKIKLDVRSVLDMREVDALSSGVLCGPKAANLGQLKQMFPEQVVEGLVIPFGIFRAHMDQTMPGRDASYWSFLNTTFERAKAMEGEQITTDSIEKYVLDQLTILREAIVEIPLEKSFIQNLENQFFKVLGKPMGEIPVFLRSDTNMEDLKDFTGAGLNLTLFNIVDPAAILEGIKKVWASPYTERSFKWRQRYLDNPENVYPSILIIPSVDVEYSGVLITKGISTDQADDLTLAISRGAGGAVDGQAAESYLLTASGTNHLLTPAREPFYRRLPLSGGTSKLVANFNSPIAPLADLNTIREFAIEVERTFPSFAQSPSGAYDVEFGFKDGKLWLFQIRPFVEQQEVELAATATPPTPPAPVEGSDALQPQDNMLWWILGFAILCLIIAGGWIFYRRQQADEKIIS